VGGVGGVGGGGGGSCFCCVVGGGGGGVVLGRVGEGRKTSAERLAQVEKQTFLERKMKRRGQGPSPRIQSTKHQEKRNGAEN